MDEQSYYRPSAVTKAEAAVDSASRQYVEAVQKEFPAGAQDVWLCSGNRMLGPYIVRRCEYVFTNGTTFRVQLYNPETGKHQWVYADRLYRR